MALNDFFVWGNGGQQLTPEEIEQRRQLEAAILSRSGVDTSPVGSPLEGIGRVVNAAAGAYRRNRLEGAAKDNATYNAGLISALTGGSTGSSIPSPGASAELGNTAPAGDPSYRNAIASIESAGSGDYGAVGPTNPKMGRALGRYQIMEANIGPWSQEALGRTVTPDEFLANPQIQDAIFDKKFGSYVSQFGPEGAAQAWFAGPGGVGKLDRRDSLGTSVGDYGRRFTAALGSPTQVASLDPAAGMPAPEAQAQIQGPQPSAPALPPATTVAAPPPIASVPTVSPAPVQPPAPNMQVAQDVSGPALANAIKVLSDPRANANTKAIAEIMVRQAQARQQAVLEQQLKQADPAYQLGLEKDRLTVDQLRNPPEPDSVRALRSRAEAAGLTPGTPEFANFMITQGVKPPANVGTPPAGYQIKYDNAGNPVSMAPIPGGPADTSKKDAAVSDSKETFTDVITNAASLARKAMADADLPTTGVLGRVAGAIMPGSSAAEVRRQVGVLKSNATIENLNAMRQQSPTGGALGNVTEGEGAMLSAKAGALDPDSPTFARDLDDYERTLLRIVHGKEQGDKIFGATRPPEVKPAAPDPVADMPAPEGMDPAVWKFVPPEDRKLWLKK